MKYSRNFDFINYEFDASLNDLTQSLNIDQFILVSSWFLYETFNRKIVVDNFFYARMIFNYS